MKRNPRVGPGGGIGELRAVSGPQGDLDASAVSAHHATPATVADAKCVPAGRVGPVASATSRQRFLAQPT